MRLKTGFAAAVVGAGCLFAAMGAQAGVIFSEDFSGATKGTYGSGDLAGTKFTVTSPNIDVIGLPQSFQCEDFHAGACLDLVGNTGQGGITSNTAFSLVAGATYTVDFGSNLQGYGVNDIAQTTFNVSLGGQTLLQTLTAADGNRHFSLVFNPLTDMAGVLNFQSLTSPDTIHGVVLDNITITEQLGNPTPSGAPEPAAWALMILGMGGVGAGLRSRRRMVAA